MPTIRTHLLPGDIGSIVYLHGILYAREYNFDHTFEAYVAGPLATFALAPSDRQRIWIAEHEGKVVGCIAIVEAAPEIAQLRWFLVDPSMRGIGLGRKLIEASVEFCRDAGYSRIILWTVSALTAAAHLYRALGFEIVERISGTHWGVEVIEEKYEREVGI
jgi:GNAT superfamily N-acetyltransferase